MIRVYRYRLNPTRAQDAALRVILERLRELYNAALEERRMAHRAGIRLTAYGQMTELSAVREARPEYAGIHTHLLQDAIMRLDRTFRAFFRRCKTGGAPGYPRFKGRGRYKSFVFKDAGRGNGVGFVSGGKRVRISGVGNVKVRLHRPIGGRVKTASVRLASDGRWYIAFACEVEPVPLPTTGLDVGIDVGLKSFLATSDGETVANPRPLASGQAEVARAQRRVSRRKRGGSRRRKAVVLLARKHARVANARRDFHHKTAHDLVCAYDLIAVEDLQVGRLARSMLAAPIHDVGWGSFLTILANKAECAGREVVKVNPSGTSKTCSACGATVPKTLADRTHRCACGFVEDRDVNAALNILRLGRSLRRGAAEVGPPDDPRSL